MVDEVGIQDDEHVIAVKLGPDGKTLSKHLEMKQWFL